MLSAVTLGLTSCATAPMEASAVPTSPHSLIYTYLMAHGMAFGYVMGGNVDQKGLELLVAIDHNAQLSVANELKQPSAEHLQQANQAVETLLAFVTPPNATVSTHRRAADQATR